MSPNTAPEVLNYTYRPSVLGAGWEFALGPRGIDWDRGSKSGHVPYRSIRRIQMSYRPMSMQSHRFVTEIWTAEGPRLRIVSTSWKSMVEQERLDAVYSAFITALHRRVFEAGATPVYRQGREPLMYWPGVAAFVVVALGLAALIVRALEAHALGGAAFIGVFLLLFVWQGGNFFRRNRPGEYRPDALPLELLPRNR
jgi:hypothetical protein